MTWTNARTYPPETTEAKTCTRCTATVEWSESDHDWFDSAGTGLWTDFLCPATQMSRHTVDTYVIPAETLAVIDRLTADVADETEALWGGYR